VFRRDMSWLKQCDLFVAEVSGASFGLGFETGYLLGSTNKTVILLYRRAAEKMVSLLITGNTHANCTPVPYATVEEIEAFLHANIPDGRTEQKALAP
jgi:NADP-dependent 3-hydroxy acid dehydrogenase YdfG